MINIKPKISILFLVLVGIIMIFISLYFLRKIQEESIIPGWPIEQEENRQREIAVLKQVFRDNSNINYIQKNQYKIYSNDKIEYSIIDNSPIKEKRVDIKLLNMDLYENGENEIIALTSLIFNGDTCTACRSRFYINILKKEKEKYIILNEQEFKSLESNLFLSDIKIKNADLLDINNDNVKEIKITFRVDDFLGLDKIKHVILQWQENKFKVIWQQVIHINMDNYGRLLEEDKENQDTTYAFEKSDGDYPNIIVEKYIYKKSGIELNPPGKEKLIYKWNSEKKEYYLFKEEKITE
ncbi:MAG: hypothetical protein PHI53_00015 [Candidatus Pacebacteria bacterium]|nr:hypothetical protein [Candidatus Paceibacterota bacterium]